MWSCSAVSTLRTRRRRRSYGLANDYQRAHPWNEFILVVQCWQMFERAKIRQHCRRRFCKTISKETWQRNSLVQVCRVWDELEKHPELWSELRVLVSRKLKCGCWRENYRQKGYTSSTGFGARLKVVGGKMHCFLKKHENTHGGRHTLLCWYYLCPRAPIHA